MKKIQQTIAINCSAKQAFDFTLDPNNTPKWVSALVTEQASETPAKLGTVYKNQDASGNWREFVITQFERDKMFEMTEKGSNVHVKYTFIPLGNEDCQLQYDVTSTEGKLAGPFNAANIKQILQKLKTVIEK